MSQRTGRGPREGASALFLRPTLAASVNRSGSSRRSALPAVAAPAFPDESPDDDDHVGVLTNTLLAAYCTLRELESDLFGDGTPRARYALMGALMVAQDGLSGEQVPGQASA
jgi:hypothetical protein